MVPVAVQGFSRCRGDEPNILVIFIENCIQNGEGLSSLAPLWFARGILTCFSKLLVVLSLCADARFEQLCRHQHNLSTRRFKHNLQKWAKFSKGNTCLLIHLFWLKCFWLFIFMCNSKKRQEKRRLQLFVWIDLTLSVRNSELDVWFLSEYAKKMLYD